MKKILTCVLSSSILVSSMVGCTNVNQVNTVSASKKVLSYTLYVSTIASILPNVKQDIERAYTTLKASKILTPEETTEIVNAKQSIDKITLGLDTLLHAKNTNTVLISATHLDEYVGLSRAIYSDMYKIVVPHKGKMRSTDLYRLKQFDSKMRSLDEAYSILTHSRIGSVDVTPILSDILSLVRTSMTISDLTKSYSGTEEKMPK